MAHESSSRKRHRNEKLKITALLAASCCIFAAGALTLCFTLSNASMQAGAQEGRASPSAQSAASQAPDASETGESISPTNDAAGTAEAKSGQLLDISQDLVQEDQESVPAQEPKDNKTSEEPKASKETSSKNKAASKKQESKEDSSEGSSTSDGSSQNAAAPPTRKTLHHTAFKKLPVYRTLHHLAKRQVSTGADGTCITWSPCPICNKRHTKSYTEKVVDHYTYEYCKACGKKHDHAFTEVITS